MSVTIPSQYGGASPLEVTPSSPILSSPALTLVRDKHLHYARSGIRIPMYWGDGASSISGAFAHVGDFDGISGV